MVILIKNKNEFKKIAMLFKLICDNHESVNVESFLYGVYLKVDVGY